MNDPERKTNPPESGPVQTDPVQTDPGQASSVHRSRWGWWTLGIILFGSTVVHGTMDHRWSAPVDRGAASRKLASLPQTMGDWTMVTDQGLDPAADRLLDCHASIVRTYRHRDTGDRVTAAVMHGRRGPMAVHTPEVCYGGGGTRTIGGRQSRSIDVGDQSHSFWSVALSPPNEPGTQFASWYAWSDGGRFQAAEHPRMWMAQDLYKIQLAGPSKPEQASEESFDACRSFLTAALPALSTAMR